METTDFEVWLAAERVTAHAQMTEAAKSITDSRAEQAFEDAAARMKDAEAAWRVLQTFKRAQIGF